MSVLVCPIFPWLIVIAVLKFGRARTWPSANFADVDFSSHVRNQLGRIHLTIRGRELSINAWVRLGCTIRTLHLRSFGISGPKFWYVTGAQFYLPYRMNSYLSKTFERHYTLYRFINFVDVCTLLLGRLANIDYRIETLHVTRREDSKRADS